MEMTLEHAEFILDKFVGYGGSVTLSASNPKYYKAVRKVDNGITEIVGSYDELEELVANLEAYMEGIE